MKFQTPSFASRLFPFLPSLIVCSLFSACSPTYYSANSQNVPLMKEQGDVKIQGGLGDGEEATKIEFQGSASPADHFALMLNYAYYTSESESSNGTYTTDKGEGNLAEIGAGYYGVLPNKMWVYECYLGYGIGNGQNTLSSEYTSFKLNRIFIQPNFGFSTDFFDAIFSVRGAYLNYTYVRQFNSDPNYSIDYPLYEKGYFVLEPSVTLRAGYKFAKAQLQFGYSGNLTQEDFPQDRTHISFMLMMDLQRGYFTGGK